MSRPSQAVCPSRVGVASHAGLVVQSQSANDAPGSATGCRPRARRSGASAESPATPRVVAEGRVVAYPGAEVVVGTEAAGRIVRLNVEGEVGRPQRRPDRRAERRRPAGLPCRGRGAGGGGRSRHPLLRARGPPRRVAARPHAATPQNLDVNRRGLETARARRAAAVAGRDRFDALIAKTRIIAPIDGVVTARHAHPGEMVEPVTGPHDRRPEPAPHRGRGRRVRRRPGGLGSPVMITAEGYAPSMRSRGLSTPGTDDFSTASFPPFSRPILTLTGPVGSGCQTCVLASFPVFCLLSSQGRLVLVSLRTCC